MNDIAPAEIEEIDAIIKLANRDPITPGLLKMLKSCVGK